MPDLGVAGYWTPIQDECVSWAAGWLRINPSEMRWTPLAEQFGGLVKLGSGCRQAATFSVPVAL